MKKLKVLRFTLILLCSLFCFTPTISAKTINSGTYQIRVYNQNDDRVVNVSHAGWGTTKHFTYSSSGANNVKSIGFLVQLPQPLLNDTYYDFEFDCTIISASNYERVNIDGYDVSGWEQYIGQAKFGVDQDDNHVIGYLERGYVTSSYVDSIMIRLYLADGYYGGFDVCLNSFSYNVNGTAAGFDEIDTVITTGISSVNSNVSNVSNQVVSLENSIIEYNSTIESGLSDVNNSIGEGVAAITGGIANEITGLEGVVNAGVGSIINEIQSSNTNISNILTNGLIGIDSDTGENYSYLDKIEENLLIIWATLNFDFEPLLQNINSNIGAIANDMVVGFSNLNSNMVNGFNTINRDIQEQMIAQTTNILNAVAQQTNTLDSTIKTMDKNITDKLDETLNLQDDTPVNDNDTLNSELGDVVGEYDEIEKDLVTDFNDSLDSIDIEGSSNIYNQNDFIKSAQFVSSNMQNIYDSNDFVGGMIDFTLLLGLIFTVIGISVARG